MASVQGGQAKVGGFLPTTRAKAGGFTPTAGQQRAVSGGAQGHWALQGGPAESLPFPHSRGVRGGHPLTFLSTNPVQGVEVDGAPGPTTAGVEEGDGTPAACSNTREGKGVPPPKTQEAKSS